MLYYIILYNNIYSVYIYVYKYPASFEHTAPSHKCKACCHCTAWAHASSAAFTMTWSTVAATARSWHAWGELKNIDRNPIAGWCFFLVNMWLIYCSSWLIPWLLYGYWWLVMTGWWLGHLPLWKMMEFVSWDYDLPNIWKNKKCSKPATRYTMKHDGTLWWTWYIMKNDNDRIYIYHDNYTELWWTMM